MRILPFVVVSLGLITQSALAEQAFFSADGQSVTFVPRTASGFLYRLDVASGKVEKLVLSAPGADDGVIALCRGGDGEALFVTDKGVFVHDAKGTRKISELPVKVDYGIDGIAAAPAKTETVGDWMFLTGQAPEDPTRRILFARKPGQKAFVPVFCRRVKIVSDPVFTADGRFFFSEDGDLWEGAIEAADDSGMAVAGTLIGARIAPLGFFNTDGANGGSMWANEIMPAGKSIYVRLAGHHMSALVRVPLMPAIDAGGEVTPKEAYQYQAQMLAQAKMVETEGDEVQIAAATEVGGEKVFYRASHEGTKGLFIWDHQSGKSRKVGVEPSDPE